MPHSPSWDSYLRALELCWDERAELLQSAADTESHQASYQSTMIDHLPQAQPTAQQRERALRLQSQLAQQAVDIDSALAALTIEIERVEKLREAQLSRVVTEINAGGFEARA